MHHWRLVISKLFIDEIEFGVQQVCPNSNSNQLSSAKAAGGSIAFSPFKQKYIKKCFSDEISKILRDNESRDYVVHNSL